MTARSLSALALLCVVGCVDGKSWDYDHGIYHTSTSFTDKWDRKWTCEPCPEGRGGIDFESPKFPNVGYWSRGDSVVEIVFYGLGGCIIGRATPDGLPFLLRNHDTYHYPEAK